MTLPCLQSFKALPSPRGLQSLPPFPPLLLPLYTMYLTYRGSATHGQLQRYLTLLECAPVLDPYLLLVLAI